MLSPAQFREEAPSFMDSWSCYGSQFTKPGSLTQLTVPSVSRATIYIFAQNPLMALKYQHRPHPIEPLALGDQWCPCSPPFQVGGSSLSACLPAAGFKAQAGIPTHSGESSLGKRDASSTTICSRCFLFYRLLSCAFIL